MSQSRLLSILVENKPGVLNRVASAVRRRGFNIDSLSVGPTEDPSVSRMTVAVHVGRQQAEQATKQLAKLIDVITIDDISGQRVVAHELLLLRMHAPNSSRRDLLDILEIFRGRVVDIASESVIVEVTGSTEKVDNFIELMRPFGIKEMARSGAVALVRGDDARLRLIDFDTPRDPEPPSPAAEPGEAVDMTGNV
ncbi:MAG: acetolactate synthase small subunit [Candidatus Aeolococcus gillhamiae]|uniref:Acetolactate synthase small subunit n=1 Tax=Candidatus Aeolococcus gillhamiae TaxID=3127015 RepID=A0A2W6A673_9BACT|nr:MAG: acetolactate synthase small subunit [Candidatus Dormibacter sp. RRmetagenome_bin12]